MQESIKLWVSQILNRSIPDLSIITNPTTMRQLLMLLQPQFFRPHRHNTVQQMLSSITQYFRSQLHLDVTKKSKSPSVLDLWELVLGIAIKCPERNSYIKMILNFDETTMANLMSFINLITEDCVEVTESKIDESNKLEKALLATIDELTEENSQLKDKLEALEEGWEGDRSQLEDRLRELKREVNQLKAERLEVLGEYEAEGRIGTLLEIFKSIEMEGSQLRSALDTKDQIIRSYEDATEELTRDCQKLRDENREMKKHHNRVHDLERQYEEAQLTIRDLKQAEKKNLKDIYQLEEKYLNLRKKLEKGVSSLADQLPRFDSDPTNQIPNSQFLISLHPASQAPSSSLPTALPTLLQQPQPPASPQRKTTIKRQLVPFVREQQNAIKVKQLQKVVNELSLKMEDKQVEIDELKKLTQERNEKIEDLEGKITQVERLNRLYAENLRERERFEEGKEEEYRGRFEELVAEIQDLKREEGVRVQAMGEMSEKAIGERKLISQQYEEKIEKIVAMLQRQLMEFRDKELDYLEKIRRLDEQVDKLTKPFKPVVQMVEEQAFTTSTIFEAGDQTQPTQSIQPIQSSQPPSSPPVPQPSTLSPQQTHQLQTIRHKIVSLQSIITQNNELINRLEAKLRESLERQSKHLQKLTEMEAKEDNLNKKLEEYKGRFLGYLEGVLSEMKDRMERIRQKEEERVRQALDTANQEKVVEAVKEEVNMKEVDQYGQAMKKIVDQITNIKHRQQEHLQSIMQLSQKKQSPLIILKQIPQTKNAEHQIKILDFFKNELSQIEENALKIEKQPEVQPVEKASLNEETINTHPTDNTLSELDISLSSHHAALTSLIQPQQPNARTQPQPIQAPNSPQPTQPIAAQPTSSPSPQLLHLTHQLTTQSQQICSLTQSVTTLQANNALLQSENLSLRGKLDELSAALLKAQSSQFYEEVTRLIDQLQTARDKYREDVEELKGRLQSKEEEVRALRERGTPSDGKEQAGVLRTVNARLLEQMALQQKTLEIFRMKYRAMFEESRAIKEQNQVLVAVIADLRVGVKAGAQ